MPVYVSRSEATEVMRWHAADTRWAIRHGLLDVHPLDPRRVDIDTLDRLCDLLDDTWQEVYPTDVDLPPLNPWRERLLRIFEREHPSDERP